MGAAEFVLIGCLGFILNDFVAVVIVRNVFLDTVAEDGSWEIFPLPHGVGFEQSAASATCGDEEGDQ
ncbi:MAG: hypothetical protein FWD57_14795 [Polyangiaceae bacterium]|nr:hypothetical protein [Polyangiaceae bacterium]